MAPTERDKEPGRRVREARIAAGLTATETALAAGISRTTLWNIEQGHSRPQLLVRASLAAVLSRAPEELFSDESVVTEPSS